MTPSVELSPAHTDISRLEVLQLDALRELANMGSGHAATALSEMTGRCVMIDVPSVSVAARGALTDVVGSGRQPLLLVRLHTSGSFGSALIMAFSERAAHDLTDMLLGRTTTGADWLDAIGASTMKEVGNVLCGAYLNALAGVTGWTIDLSTPELLYARADWAVELLAMDRPPSDFALCLETSLRIDGAPTRLRGHVLLFPLLGSLPALLERLGVR